MSPSKKKIKQIYIPKVDYVNVNDSAEDVAKLMRKYDLRQFPSLMMTDNYWAELQ